MGKFYIILTKPKRKLARMAIKILTGSEYFHVMITVDFIRVYAMKDRIILELFPPKAEHKIFEFKASAQQIEKLQENIERYWNNKAIYKLNTPGSIIGTLIGVPLFRMGHVANWLLKDIMQAKNKFICSNFVAQMLYESGINIFKNPKAQGYHAAYFCVPSDFLKAEGEF